MQPYQQPNSLVKSSSELHTPNHLSDSKTMRAQAWYWCRRLTYERLPVATDVRYPQAWTWSNLTICFRDCISIIALPCTHLMQLINPVCMVPIEKFSCAVRPQMLHWYATRCRWHIGRMNPANNAVILPTQKAWWKLNAVSYHDQI